MSAVAFGEGGTLHTLPPSRGALRRDLAEAPAARRRALSLARRRCRL